MMANCTGPIQIPDLEQAVAAVVERFAKSRGLEHELWYHDEPLWLVLKHEDKITRSSQVGAYIPTAQREGQPALFFIPNAYFFDEEQLKAFAVSEDRVQKNVSLDIASRIKASNESQELLRTMLEDAWNLVEKFSVSNFKESLGTIPAKF